MGKGNFLIRLLLKTKETVEALTELENHTQGNSPERKKRGNCFIWNRKIIVKAMKKTRVSKRGLSKDHRMPREVLLYWSVISLWVSIQRRSNSLRRS